MVRYLWWYYFFDWTAGFIALSLTFSDTDTAEKRERQASKEDVGKLFSTTMLAALIYCDCYSTAVSCESTRALIMSVLSDDYTQNT